MKAVGIVLPLLALMAMGQDPTRPADGMAERLKAKIADSGALRIQALVVGAAGEGVALVGSSGADTAMVRKGSVLSRNVDGMEVALKVKSVTSDGVELETSAGAPPLFVPGSYKALPAPEGMKGEFLRHLEASSVPLEKLLRLVSDQAGVNISSSEATAKKSVSVFLRNVDAATAVEEICRTTGLWFRREGASSVMRVTTMQEYTDNLSSFREEKTETFTLLYPNVVEAAAVIYGLYPERTMLSLGEEDFDEDEENDLSRRFRRFQVVADNGGSTFLKFEPPDANSSSGGRTASGDFSYSRGGGMQSRRAQWEWLRKASKLPGLTQSEAKRAELALAKADTNLFEKVYGRNTAQAANIFVSLSRRNNLLVVRTSDAEAMESIRSLVRRIDVPTPMVLLEMKVMELDIDDDYNAVFKYSFNSKGSHSWGNHGGNPGNLLGAIDPSAVNPMAAETMSFAILSDTLDAQMQLMQQDGKIRVLATPLILTANSEVSRVFSGAERPIVKGVTAGDTVTSESGIVTRNATVNLEWVDVGTMLLVTPNINADRTVTLRVLQENSEIPSEQVRVPLDGGNVNETTPVDIVESRSVTGTFVAKDGMTVVAGGLIKETWKEVYTRTPILGSMPLFGFLFRGTEKQKKRTELIVTIKPHVISTPYEGGKISDELLKALSAHPSADGRANMGIHYGSSATTNNLNGIIKDLQTITR